VAKGVYKTEDLYVKGSVDKGCTSWNQYKLKAKGSSLSNVNKHNMQKYGKAYRLNFSRPKTQTGCENDAGKAKKQISILIKNEAAVLSAPKTHLEVEISEITIFTTDFNNGRELYETLMRPRDRILRSRGRGTGAI
jgi:hypothetical protein